MAQDPTLLPTEEVATALPRQAVARSRGGRARRRGRIAWLFAGPALLLHVCVVAIPSLFTFGISFFNWNGIGTPTFAGLTNYAALPGDATFRVALVNNFKWVAVYLTVPLIMGLGAAVLVAGIQYRSVQMIYRSIYYLPATVAGVVVARIWAWIYHPFFGLNLVLQNIGLGVFALPWLSDTNLALFSVSVADNWRWWGFLLIIFLAALQQIDHTLYEAAAVDGANRWQMFWHITLPSLRPTLGFVALTSVIFSFLVLEMVFLMTSGGPGNATQVTSFWIYSQAIYNLSYGYAAAMAVVMTLFLAVLITLMVVIQQRRWQE